MVTVLGAGGHAKVVIATLRAAGTAVSAVLDDDPATWGHEVLGVRITGPMEGVEGPAIIAVGSNAARARIATKLWGVTWATAVHPSAVVAEGVRIGAGSVVFAGVVIQPDSTVGEHVILNTAASVDHDNVIEDFVHLAPGVHLAGDVRVGRGAFLGLGTSVIPGIRIGADAVIGAGAVIVRDVGAGVTAVGVPARAR